MSDTFDTVEAEAVGAQQDPGAQWVTAGARPEPKRDRFGRYLLPSPGVGGLRTTDQPWTRVTTLVKAASDTFGLDAWKQRNVVKGLTTRPDLLTLASTLDVKRDAKTLNTIVGQAMEAAGSGTAATLGTAIHSMTETYDVTNSLASVPKEYRRRIRQYSEALTAANVIVLPELVERITASSRFRSAGTLDRIVRLSDGSYCILDVKSGSSLEYVMWEIAAQLAVYADGVNNAGLWGGRKWDRSFQGSDLFVREDFALVAHLPATGDGCELVKVDLEPGRRWAELCLTVRDARSDRSEISSVVDGDPVGGAGVWETGLDLCVTREELVEVAKRARIAGAWTEALANRARALAAQF